MTPSKSPAAGEAGRAAADVRSDAWVRLELADAGGLQLEVQSKVLSYYGEAIRTQARAICEAMSVQHARLRIEDRGALPFTLAARIECAARRALGDVKPVLPEPLDHLKAPRQRDALRRSRLYLPGNEPKFLINAALYGADAIILDLEDAVAPAEKDAARILVRNALRSIDFGDAERMVRINSGELGLLDLEVIVPQNPDVILLPKCEDPALVSSIADRIQSIQRKTHTERPVWLMPILETALGIERAYDIAVSTSQVAALTIGLEDYCADLGVARTVAGRESLYARMALVNAAKAAGVQAIDSVYSDVADLEGLRASTLEAKGLGFEGKGCIHPRQIAVIHEALAPQAAEIERAQNIVTAFEAASSAGLGVVALGSKMIDAPVVKRAQHTVDVAIMLGLLSPDWREASK